MPKPKPKQRPSLERELEREHAKRVLRAPAREGHGRSRPMSDETRKLLAEARKQRKAKRLLEPAPTRGKRWNETMHDEAMSPKGRVPQRGTANAARNRAAAVEDSVEKASMRKHAGVDWIRRGHLPRDITDGQDSIARSRERAHRAESTATAAEQRRDKTLVATHRQTVKPDATRVARKPAAKPKAPSVASRAAGHIRGAFAASQRETAARDSARNDSIDRLRGKR